MNEPQKQTGGPLVRVEDLSVHFPVRGGVPFGKKKKVRAVSHVSLCIPRGETFGLVGESGCGKSTLANAILGMVKPTGGRVLFKGQDVHALSGRGLRELRRDMQMIFQDPFSSLNPRFDVFRLVSEPMLIRGGYTKAEMEQRVLELLELVGLSAEDLHRYPSDFSGGQRQRIGIARAISTNPGFVVCDEPVSALDVSIQAQVINLLSDLQKQLDLAYLFISHNLAVVKDICPSVAVMYLGCVMETGVTRTIFDNPLHPYTQSLLSAVLDVDVDSKRERVILKGEIPSPIDVPSGCPFCTRCPKAGPLCAEKQPEPVLAEPGHFVSCHYPGPL